jgi:hypothetical protein
VPGHQSINQKLSSVFANRETSQWGTEKLAGTEHPVKIENPAKRSYYSDTCESKSHRNFPFRFQSDLASSDMTSQHIRIDVGGPGG